MTGNRRRSFKKYRSHTGPARFYSNHRIVVALVILILFIFGISSNTQAQSFAIDWWTFGGSGSSTGGEFSLTGITGQHAAGSIAGGVYSINSGFWAMAAPYYLYLPLTMK